MEKCYGLPCLLPAFSPIGSSPQNHPPSPAQGFPRAAGDPALASGTPTGKGSGSASALGLQSQGSGSHCCKLRASWARNEELAPSHGAVLLSALQPPSRPLCTGEPSLPWKHLLGLPSPLGLGKEQPDQAEAVLSCGLLSRKPHLVAYFVMN